MGRRHSTARVSKRLTYLTAACLRARYCADLALCPVFFIASPLYRTSQFSFKKEIFVFDSVAEYRA